MLESFQVLLCAGALGLCMAFFYHLGVEEGRKKAMRDIRNRRIKYDSKILELGDRY